MEMKVLNKGLEFEKRCVEKLIQIGFTDVSLTKYTDYGADILAYDGPIKYIFQCKNEKAKQGIKAVQEVLAAKNFYSAHKCSVISVSNYTPQAQKLAKPNYCFLITSLEFFALDDKNSFIKVSIDKLAQVGLDFNIIKKYEDLKNELGRTPTWRQLDKSLRYQIRKDYKKYSVFLDKIGDQFVRRKATEEQLKKEYTRIRDIIGKTPTAEDLKKNSTIPLNSFQSYPLTKLQKECGDSPNLEKGVTKETLITEYLNLRKKLGRSPSRDDLNKLGKYRYSYYVHRWGNLSNFLKEINISASEVLKRKYTKHETVIVFSLIEAIIRIKENNPRAEINTTHLKNLRLNNEILFDKGIISNKFGGYKNFLETIETNRKYSDFRQKLKHLLTS